jgi:hypothetical protein
MGQIAPSYLGFRIEAIGDQKTWENRGIQLAQSSYVDAGRCEFDVKKASSEHFRFD